MSKSLLLKDRVVSGILRMKTGRFSHRQFCLEIEVLYCSSGKGAFGRKPIHDQWIVGLEHIGHFFQGFALV